MLSGTEFSSLSYLKVQRILVCIFIFILFLCVRLLYFGERFLMISEPDEYDKIYVK